jgi:membrane-bound serine protease (ClpP class)
MKPYLYTLLCLLTFATAGARAQTNQAAQPLVYTIPIQGMIERGLLYVVRRGVNEALRNDADAIVFDMDTPGGRVDVTEEIIRTLIDLPESVVTYTYINKDALSAGALIATATRHIYMAPGSRIGASAIVTSTGDIEEGDLKEKHVSALSALVRSAAERNGHDPKLIECMIRKDLKYELDGNVIVEEGRLLTLTDLDAGKMVKRNDSEEPLLSEGTASNLTDLLAQVGLMNAKVQRIEVTGSEKVARWIELFGFLFLAGGVLGIYIEFKTPGFGIPGVTGIILLAIFFWGHTIAGLTGAPEIMIFVIGLILLALEVFVIPGFGVAGIAGISLILLSLFMAMVQHYPGTNWFDPPSQIQFSGALQSLGLALAIALAMGLVVANYLPKTYAFQNLMLSAELDQEHGVTAAAPMDSLVGAKGKAVTPLHPAGIGSFSGKRHNVVARGAFIDKESAIIVAEVYGNRIVVDIDRSDVSGPDNKSTGEMPT